MEIYILTIFVITMFIISLVLGKFLFSPISLIMLSYLASIMLAIPNIEIWNIDLGQKTIIVVVLGLLAFAFGYCLSIIFSRKKGKEVIKLKQINVPIFSRFVSDILNIMTVVLIFLAVSKIVGPINLANFGKKIGDYRLISAYADDTKSIPGYLIQLYKISTVCSYFMSFITINNLIYSKKMKTKENRYIIDFVICFTCQFVLALLSGGRYNIITFIIGIITIVTIIKSSDKKSISKTLPFKSYLKIFSVLLIVVVLFSRMRGIVGRTNSNTTISYISSYFGGSVPLLDKKLKNNLTESKMFGSSTFYPLYRLISKFGLPIEVRSGNLDFTSSGTLTGNVYTSFYPIFIDFGFVGVFILELICGFVCYKIFCHVYKKNIYCKQNIILIIIYSMHVSSLYLHSYSETFYNYLFSQTFILELIYCLLIYCLFFKLKVKFRKDI